MVQSQADSSVFEEEGGVRVHLVLVVHVDDFFIGDERFPTNNLDAVK